MSWLFKRKQRLSLRRGYKGVVSLLSQVWSWSKSLLKRWSGQLRRQAVIARMQKADIILASPRTTQLSPIALIYRLILRSRYVHTMLYIGDSKIIHTTTRYGVALSKVPRKIYDKNRYAIFRVKNLNAAQREWVVAEALKRGNAKLDYAGMITVIPSRLLHLRKNVLRSERNRIWCSKLVYQAFLSAGIELLPPEKAENITSEDLSRNPRMIRI